MDDRAFRNGEIMLTFVGKSLFAPSLEWAEARARCGTCFQYWILGGAKPEITTREVGILCAAVGSPEFSSILRPDLPKLNRLTDGERENSAKNRVDIFFKCCCGRRKLAGRRESELVKLELLLGRRGELTLSLV